MSSLLSIIIADDHQLLREGLCTVLHKAGFYVAGQAANGKELVELAGKLQPDIIITDINMPVMNGIQATKILSTLCPATRIIAFSFMDNEFAVVEMLEAGALGYLCKNACTSELKQAIWKVYSDIPFFCSATSSYLGTQIAKSKFNPYKKFKPVFTIQEVRIIRLITFGHSTKQISSMLHVSLRTVDAHRRNILDKLNIRSSIGIMIYAVKNQIVKPDELPDIINQDHLN